MKTIKFFAFLMAAVFIAACNPEKPEEVEVNITLDKETLNLEVGESALLVATVTPAGAEVTWTSLNPNYVTVDNTGLVTAVAEGTTIVIATSNGVRAQCNVIVGKGTQLGGNSYTLKEASEYYPLYVDDATMAKMGDKVKINFSVDDQKNHFWPWIIEGTEILTYEFVTATGPNFYGTDEGGYMALVAANNAGWAGGGYSVQADELQQLVDAINQDPDNFYFHMGLRSTDGYGNAFYFFGLEAETKFVIGASSIYSGTVLTDFKRDGYWYEFDIPMSKYAAAFSSFVVADHLKEGEDPYIFSFLTQGINGAQLNYDALYFYKK